MVMMLNTWNLTEVFKFYIKAVNSLYTLATCSFAIYYFIMKTTKTSKIRIRRILMPFQLRLYPCK